MFIYIEPFRHKAIQSDSHGPKTTLKGHYVVIEKKNQTQKQEQANSNRISKSILWLTRSQCSDFR